MAEIERLTEILVLKGLRITELFRYDQRGFCVSAIEHSTGKSLVVKGYISGLQSDRLLFHREVTLLANFNNNSFPKLIESWIEPDFLVFSYEHISAISLKQFLETSQDSESHPEQATSFTEERLNISEVVEDLINVIVHLHGQGIVHGQIDTSHILIGQDRKIRLIGFGTHLRRSDFFRDGTLHIDDFNGALLRDYKCISILLDQILETFSTEYIVQMRAVFAELLGSETLGYLSIENFTPVTPEKDIFSPEKNRPQYVEPIRPSLVIKMMTTVQKVAKNIRLRLGEGGTGARVLDHILDQPIKIKSQESEVQSKKTMNENRLQNEQYRNTLKIENVVSKRRKLIFMLVVAACLTCIALYFLTPTSPPVDSSVDEWHQRVSLSTQSVPELLDSRGQCLALDEREVAECLRKLVSEDSTLQSEPDDELLKLFNFEEQDIDPQQFVLEEKQKIGDLYVLKYKGELKSSASQFTVVVEPHESGWLFRNVFR